MTQLSICLKEIKDKFSLFRLELKICAWLVPSGTEKPLGPLKETKAASHFTF